MALTNYADLVSAIQSFMMDRSDLSTPAPDFITLGEGVINWGMDGNAGIPRVPALRCREMEVIDDLTPTSGVCALPSDYLQYRRVVETSSPRRDLDYIAPTSADQMYTSRSSGLACHFTIVGASLYTFPLASNDIELTYYGKVPALTSVATTNWLMTKRPDIYLRASLMMAAEWIKMDDEAAKQAAMLSSLVVAMNGSDQMANINRAGITFKRQVR
jgi:hypothetical protein